MALGSVSSTPSNNVSRRSQQAASTQRRPENIDVLVVGFGDAVAVGMGVASVKAAAEKGGALGKMNVRVIDLNKFPQGMDPVELNELTQEARGNFKNFDQSPADQTDRLVNLFCKKNNIAWNQPTTLFRDQSIEAPSTEREVGRLGSYAEPAAVIRAAEEVVAGGKPNVQVVTQRVGWSMK